MDKKEKKKKEKRKNVKYMSIQNVVFKAKQGKMEWVMENKIEISISFCMNNS